MANVKFSQLPVASPLGQSDIFCVSQTATSKQSPISSLWKPTAVGNAAYAIQPTDVYVYTSVAFTGPHIWTMPTALSYGSGRILRIVDSLNTLTSVNTLTLQRNGSDTFTGGLTTQVLGQAGQTMLLGCDGNSIWTVLAQAQSAIGNSYQAITFSAAGNVNSIQGAVATQMTFVTVNAGTGAYLGTISLPHAGISAGDVNFMSFNVAASRNPTIQIFDNNTGGTLLFEWDSDGTLTYFAVVCAYNGSAWYLHDAHFFA